MRYMIIIKGNRHTEAGEPPSEAAFAAMAAYSEELAKAGAILGGAGLTPSGQGWRIRYDGQKRTVIDGPFPETKDLVCGYAVIQADSREQALEWTRRFPDTSIDGEYAEVEVRPFHELEDFGPSEALERFKDLGMSQ